MIASDSFLHFVLDAENDIHCTDSLVSLTPGAFLWHELNRRDAGQNILLFDIRQSGRICVEVFDSDSRRFLIPPQKSFLSFGKAEEEPRVIARSSYSITDAKLTEEDLLAKLLSRANARNAERRTALVFTHTAFERVCRMADNDGVERMIAQLEANSGKCTIYVRLPLRAEELQKLVQQDLSGCPLLQKAYARFGTALDVPQEPLVSALESMLGSQLIRFDRRPREVQNLLLKQALSDPTSADTLEQLKDQAEYLALCRWHCTGLLPAGAGAESFHRVSYKQLWERLQDPQFREQLRSSTAQLRRRYSTGSLQAALLKENRLPQPPPQPVCDDELARTALSLSLPDSCTRKAGWDTTLDQIKRDLSTLWNKPRNRVAQEIALTLCREARGAINTANWKTMEEILQLLSFYARQICAAEERSEALSSVWDMGSKLVQQCRYFYGARVFGMPDDLDAVAHMGVDAGDKTTIELLQPVVRSAIRYFDRPNLVIADITRQIIEDRNRVSQAIEQSRQRNELLRQEEEKRQREEENRRKVEELTIKYTGGMNNAIEPEDEPAEPIDANRYLDERMRLNDFL